MPNLNQLSEQARKEAGEQEQKHYFVFLPSNEGQGVVSKLFTSEADAEEMISSYKYDGYIYLPALVASEIYRMINALGGYFSLREMSIIDIKARLEST